MSTSEWPTSPTSSCVAALSAQDPLSPWRSSPSRASCSRCECACATRAVRRLDNRGVLHVTARVTAQLGSTLFGAKWSEKWAHWDGRTLKCFAISADQSASFSWSSARQNCAFDLASYTFALADAADWQVRSSDSEQMQQQSNRVELGLLSRKSSIASTPST